MVYRELTDRKICLLGTEKRCQDTAAFFSELQVKQMICLEEEELRDRRKLEEVLRGLENKEEKQLLVISEAYSQEAAALLKERNWLREVSYLWLDDLLKITEEMETFYIDKMYSEKEIAVYGTGKMAEDLMFQNPSLRIDYFLSEDKERKEFYHYPVIPVEEFGYQEHRFIILAEGVSAGAKQLFLDKGYCFGKEFHFYNPRSPKHPTSFYLKKTFYDAPRYTLPCDVTTRALSIKNRGNIMACCSSLTLALGNCKYTSIEAILEGVQAQIVNLSINNRTYSFCGEMCFMFREKAYRLQEKNEIAQNIRRQEPLHAIPDFNVQLGYDRSCNLACPSCRTHRITEPEDSHEAMEMIHAEVKELCRKHPKNMRIGNGELFFSQYYKDIIFHCYESPQISLITNGMLFNQENWEKLKNKYQKIALEVSMDAVKKETYRKLRGGDLELLLKNMEFAGKLRREGKLNRLSVSFVIQVENFEEMKAFVEYGNRIGADYIHFMKLNSWGHIPEEEFIKMDVYDPRNEKHDKFAELLHDPVFRDPRVHVDNIDNFIK